MRYTIYRGKEVVVQNIHPEGTVTTKIMGEETAALSFTLPFDITFKLEDRIQIYGKNFFLADTPTIDKKSSREYVYTMSFLSLKYTLRDIQLMFYDENNELTMPAMPFMGTADKALDMVMLNIARLQPGWTKGVVDETEVKNVEFTECNCLEALSKIAETFELEFWVDDDKSIHFTERKPVSGYSFEYGKGKGLKNINRKPLEGASIVTRLYVKGSEKNLPKNYRKGQKNLRMDVPYLEKNKEIYGTKEHTETFDIYPKYEGTVTAVDADPHRFIDTGIDFDLNAYDQYGTTVLMNGVNVKVIFQTGQLAGYTLELLEAGGFNYNTKTFYLQTNKDEKAMEVPSELLRPAVGDKYILVDLMMPAQYVTNAEAELKTKGQEYLDQNCKDRFQYSMGSDRMYFKAQNVNLVLGSTVHFKDAAFALDDDIRVTSLSVDIQDPYEVKFDLNESSAVSSIVQSYYDQQSQQTTIINTVKYNAELARRNYLFAREFHDNVFDGEGYFDMENIKPLSIETKMLSLGSRMQQFALPGVDFKLANNNAMMNTAGKLSHQTIDPNGVRDWNIAVNSVIGISNAFNYIYIKAQRVGTNANFVVTEAQLKVEQDPDFYYFEVGYLSSVIDGYRKIKTTYGFAQLNPAELSIGRISDPTGNNYIDLLQDRIAIKAKVEFTSDSPAIQQVTNQIVVGGRNILLKSNLVNNPASIPYGSPYNQYWIKGATSEIKNNILSDTYYTITLWYIPKNAKGSRDFDSIVLGKRGANNNSWDLRFYYSEPSTVISKDGNFTKCSLTLKAPVGSYILNNNGSIVIIIESDNKGIDLYKFKLEKGNKATDWTPAPEDVNEDINIAQSTANNAIVLLTDLGSDNKLTASEKQTTLNEWNRIKSEYLQNYNQASTLLLSVTSYQTAYNSLNNYIAPLLTDLNSTSNIDGNTFRSTFKNYYDQNVLIVTAIGNKQIDNITVGGRNILLKSNLVNNPASIPYVSPYNQYWIKGATSEIKNNILSDTYYTITLWYIPKNAKGSRDFDSIVLGKRGANNDSWDLRFYYSEPSTVISKDGNFTKCSLTLKAPVGSYILNNNGAIAIIIQSDNKGIDLYKFKLEKGNKATDWTPAPEDIENDIATANTNSANALAQAQNALNTATSAAAVTSFMQTTVDGNVISTGTLQVGDVNGANAMISGVTDRPNGESIRFAAGQNYANKYLSPFQVLDNGMVRFVNPLTGQKTFELGFNQNTGKVVFDIYNDIGVKVASIGPSGISFTGFVPESYEPISFRKLNTGTFTNAAITAEIEPLLSKLFIQSSPPYTPHPPFDWAVYEILIQGNYNCFYYNAGRNFESAGNAQYEGYYVGENKIGNKVPNGIYAVPNRFSISIDKYGSDGYAWNTVFNYATEVLLIQNGIITNSMIITINKAISTIPIV